MMDMERFQKQLNFIIEIDKMKCIKRQTMILNEDRQENDAEHSWHLAMLAMLLSEYCDEKIDVLKVIKMVLVHDLVEIDAGDTYCYDTEGNKTKLERENKAAERIFSILPDDQKEEIDSLWREFDAMETAESRFASVLDRFQPMLLNYTKDGISWKKHGTRREQVENRNTFAKDISKDIYTYIISMLDDAENRGLLKK